MFRLLRNKLNKEGNIERQLKVFIFIHKQRTKLNEQSSFTLIELLIVIAIIGILAATVVLVLNPTQLLAQSRDGTRIQDLADINTAIKQYLADRNTNLGTSSVVYVSIPDTNSSCSDLGLPALPTGWSYHCVSTSTLTETNGNGWIPISFSSITTGNPLPTIPIDPQNTTSTGEYYTYATNGSQYELTSYFESNNYQTQAAQSGNPDPTTYALGSNLDLTPFIHGLVGYWPLNEGSGTVAYDKSGWGNNGTLADATTTESNVGPTWTTSGCLSGGSCLSFDGAGDYVSLPSGNYENFGTNNFSVSAWIKTTSSKQQSCIVSTAGGPLGYRFGFGGGKPYALYGDGTDYTEGTMGNVLLSDGNWHFLVINYFHDKRLTTAYIDGVEVGSMNINIVGSTSNTYAYIGQMGNFATFATGFFGDIRIYQYTIASAQIQAIYNSEKP